MSCLYVVICFWTPFWIVAVLLGASWYKQQISRICLSAGNTHVELIFSSSMHRWSHLVFCVSRYCVQLLKWWLTYLSVINNTLNFYNSIFLFSTVGTDKKYLSIRILKKFDDLPVIENFDMGRQCLIHNFDWYITWVCQVPKESKYCATCKVKINKP